MFGFLLVVCFIAAVLYGFVRVFRSRASQRMQQVEMPPELVAALRAKAAQASPGRPAATGAPAPMREPHFLLIYDVAQDYLQRRGQFRDAHLALAWKAADAGELVLGGALEEPVEQAILLFRGSRDAALRFAAADPYVKNGLVKAFKVKQWNTVAGATAANPVRPAR